MTKFRGLYKGGSRRMTNWDYRSSGYYFITINTLNRVHHFGEVQNKEMLLSDIGKIAHQFWTDIPKYSPHITLGASVVMPDHLHGVLILQSNLAKETPAKITSHNSDYYMSALSPRANSISTIIRSFKSALTKEAKKINPDFQWQAKFHDIIINDHKALINIEQYIQDNPANWGIKKKHPRRRFHK